MLYVLCERYQALMRLRNNLNEMSWGGIFNLPFNILNGIFFIYRISPAATEGDLNISAMPCIEFKFSNNIESILTSNLSIGTKFSSIVESEASSTLNSLVSTNSPLQTTLVSNSSIKHFFFVYFDDH